MFLNVEGQPIHLFILYRVSDVSRLTSVYNV